jgi:iron(III) transport system ATP-binding protein
MVFQSYAVWPHMTVFQNVEYPLKIQKVDKAERTKKVQNILDMVHLGEYGERYPNQLSGGQQQRVALARALVANPSLLLLDEPLSNLDAKLRESMRFEISALQKRLGITVIYVTHDQSEAMTMSDRIVVMSAGVVQQIGKPYDIYTKPANKMVADFIGLVNFLPGVVKGDRAFLEGTEVSFANDKNLTGNVTIAVRPENIKLSKTGGIVQGIMKHRFYLGDSVDYRVQVGDKHVIRVIIKGIQYGTFADGEPVYLDFDKVMLFNRE